jgi:dTDP-4-amino-4,6-dideoxygalactose transaminase
MIGSAKISVPLIEPLVGSEEIDAVVRVMKSGQLAHGPEVAAFESELAATIGVKHVVAVNSGTAAIHCGLAALGVTDGDEVLTTPFTFAATATPALMQRARVRFVDIDPETFNVDLLAYLPHVTDRTKAVIGVDLFGLPLNKDGLDQFAARNIAVFEDACQAIGASRDGLAAGKGCAAGAFSFYATKNLMMGEGGALTTDDDATAAAARRFRSHGQGERYEYVSLGYNYRLTDIAAAIGRTQLSRLAAVTNARRANAAAYDAQLAGFPGITTPLVPAGALHAYHQYSILIDETMTPNGANRDTVRTRLAEAGVASGIYYPTPLHLNPLFATGYGPGDFPVSERVARQVLALPIHPRLDQRSLEYVVSSLKTAVGG